MDNGTYTTKVKTQNGTIYDLGKGEYPPVHHHPGESPCPECFVVNAWTEKEELVRQGRRDAEQNLSKVYHESDRR